MSATLIRFPKRRESGQLGPVSVWINAATVDYGNEAEPLLELEVTLALNAVPKDQRRALVALLHEQNSLTLTLKSGNGGEGG